MNKIYVGRWDLLPKEWEGINGLYEKTDEEIKNEVDREKKTDDGYYDYFVGVYTLKEFEETFNGDDSEKLTGITYWIKIF